MLAGLGPLRGHRPEPGYRLLPLSSPRQTIVIGAKNFDEQYILADLIGDRLARADIATTQKSDLGSVVAFRALAAGDIDLYVDYSGTLWANVLHRSDMPARAAMLQALRLWLQREHGITLAGSLGFENAYVFAMRADRARALHIDSLADLAAHAGSLKVGGDFEIFSRVPNGHAVTKAYGRSNDIAKRQYQPDFLYRAVGQRRCGCHLGILQRWPHRALWPGSCCPIPLGALPPYDAVLLLGPHQAGEQRPAGGRVKPLLGAIRLEMMQRANLLVDRTEDKQTPAQAAALAGSFYPGAMKKKAQAAA